MQSLIILLALDSFQPCFTGMDEMKCTLDNHKPVDKISHMRDDQMPGPPSRGDAGLKMEPVGVLDRSLVVPSLSALQPLNRPSPPCKTNLNLETAWKKGRRGRPQGAGPQGHASGSWLRGGRKRWSLVVRRDAPRCRQGGDDDVGAEIKDEANDGYTALIFLLHSLSLIHVSLLR